MKKLFPAIFLLFLYSYTSKVMAQKDSTHFVFTIQTSHPGSSNDSSYSINTSFNLNFNYDVDWNNDGIFDTTAVTGDIKHQYDSIGTYTIRIRGTFPKIDFGRTNVGVLRDSRKLICIDQWGTTAWLELYNAFVSCINLEYSATDVPNLSKAPPIFGMFAEATKFNGDISNWDVSKITAFSSLFQGASSFNQDIGNWDVSAATDLSGMFWDATAFNQDIGNWKVDSVELMNAVFKDAITFNQDLSNWNVSSAIRMSNMFDGATSFNQDIGDWDVSSSTSLIETFKYATSFDQNLGGWQIDSVIKMWGMFDNSGLSVSNYDSTIITWQKNGYINMSIGVLGLKYCAADSARSELIKAGWSFSGDSLNCSTTQINDITSIENKNIYIFPNPSNGTLNINFREDSSQELISIYDSNANLVKQIKSNARNNQIDLSKYPNGLYFVRARNQSKKVLLVN